MSAEESVLTSALAESSALLVSTDVAVSATESVWVEEAPEPLEQALEATRNKIAQ
jgi:hypothetical protein